MTLVQAYTEAKPTEFWAALPKNPLTAILAVLDLYDSLDSNGRLRLRNRLRDWQNKP